MDSRRIEDILHFWFGALPDNETIPEDKAAMWFQASDNNDRFIKEHFGNDLTLAIAGKLDEWKNTPRGCLALIILLDQFSRNIFRHTPRAFAQDPQALDIAIRGAGEGYDKELKHIERVFFYIPFEHSESMTIQNECLKLFDELVETSPVSIEFAMANYLDYAKKHYDIIEKFNRYPHRNVILKRESTAEEIAFLNQPSASF